MIEFLCYQVTINVIFQTPVYFTEYFSVRTSLYKQDKIQTPTLTYEIPCDPATSSNPISCDFSSILFILVSNHTGLLFIPQINQVHLSSGPLLLLFTLPKTMVFMAWLCMGPRSTSCRLPRGSFLASQTKVDPYSMLLSSIHFPLSESL